MSEHPTYWYQCQERAMAPGSGDGWPAIIRPQHSTNARLVRRDGDPEAQIAALVADQVRIIAERDRLRALLVDIASDLEGEPHHYKIVKCIDTALEDTNG